MTRVLVASSMPRDAIGAVPSDVELVPIGPGEDLTGDHLNVDWIVLAGEMLPLVSRLSEFPSLRVVQTLNAGVERILPLVPPGVTLCNASGAHDIPVAEWVVGVVLATYHRLPTYFAAQQHGEWDQSGNALTTPPEEIPADDLHGKRVTIVGYGSIGRAVAERMRPFGAIITGVSRHGGKDLSTPEQLPALLPATDILVIMCPLTDETFHLIDAAALAALPDGAIVVNGARGQIIDQVALELELRSGRLRAALDVTDPEPLTENDTLWTAPNLIITPHAAGSSRHWQRRAYRFVGDQLRRASAGEPLENIRTEY